MNTESTVQATAAATLLVIVCDVMAGCGARFSETQQKRVWPVYEKGSGRLQRLDFDSDSNGKIDSRTYMDGNKPLRSEVDQNEDGVVDRWEYYAGNGQVEKVGTSSGNDGKEDTWAFPDMQGRIVRTERSTQRDGVVDSRQFFENGVLTRVEQDTNADGKLDRWEYYQGGSIRIVALDTTSDMGRPDLRLIYNDKGEFERTETDPDGTGTFVPYTWPGSSR